VRTPRRERLEPAQEEGERPGQPRGEHHVGENLMAVQEEARAGGEDGEGHEPGANAGELPSDGEHTEQGRQRRDDGRDRGVPIRGVAGGQSGQRDAPEEQGRLVEVRRVPHPGGQPEPVAKRVLREQDHARLVLEGDGATAHRHGIDDRRRAQQSHEPRPLTSRQPCCHFKWEWTE